MFSSNQLVECVPNFSEGCNRTVIKQITDAAESVEGILLLDVDPGEATNRTVVTFVGSPDAVCEAAFRAVKTAGQLIDMRQHHGAHPRIGATDVLPLIPVSGITLEECAQLARQLAERIANELRIPCYCYEAAAFRPERKNLAVCRRGEYEGIAQRIMDQQEAPDFGARPFDDDVARTGCTVVGARDFLLHLYILDEARTLHIPQKVLHRLCVSYTFCSSHSRYSPCGCTMHNTSESSIHCCLQKNLLVPYHFLIKSIFYAYTSYPYKCHIRQAKPSSPHPLHSGASSAIRLIDQCNSCFISIVLLLL